VVRALTCEIVALVTSPSQSSGGFALQDEASGVAVAATWAGSLLALGARLARQGAATLDGQLVVALTVPVRDYAAALIAAGWTLAAQIGRPGVPAELVPTLSPGTPVRMVVSGVLVAERFFEAAVIGGRARIHVGPSWWHLDAVDYLTAAPDLPEHRFGRVRLAPAGSMVTRTGHARTWIAEQCRASADVALIGTKTWLVADMGLGIGWGDLAAGFDRLDDILRPDDGRRPSWASTLRSAQLSESTSLSSEAKLSVLDGSSAIRWLPDVATPFAVALIDRSSSDEFAADSILQLRSMGRPLSLEPIGWMPPPGIEALAFEAHR
jgi:hypothetical protein